MVALFKGAARAVRDASVNFDSDDGFGLAATISYFGLVSLVPLTILLIAFGAYFLGSTDAAEKGARWMLRDLMTNLGPHALAQAKSVGSQAAELGWPFVVLALWTASQVFSRVEGALDRVFAVEKRRAFPIRKILALGFVGLLALVLIILVVGSSALASLNHYLRAYPLAGTIRANLLYRQVTSSVSRFLLPWVVAVVTFSLVYKVVPACAVPSRAAAIAGLVAGTLWEGLKHAFALYVGRIANYAQTYGVLEAVVVFAVWVNLSSVILIWGGELAAVLSGTRVRTPAGERVTEASSPSERSPRA